MVATTTSCPSISPPISEQQRAEGDDGASAEVLRCPVCRVPIAVRYRDLLVVKQDGRVMVGRMGVVRCARKSCRGEWHSTDSDLLEQAQSALKALDAYIPSRR